jgi:hypothetical protein
MNDYDLGTIGGFLAAVWQLISGVLRLNPQAYHAALALPEGWKLALTVLFIAGLSYTLGQSIVLFANRVNRRHFIFAVTVSALTLVISIFFWAVSIRLTARALFDTQQPLTNVLTVVAISFAPFLFGFLILIPYLGNIISKILRIWVFLAVTVGVGVSFQFSFWQTLLCSVLGWLLLELISRIPFLRIKQLDSWLWHISTGTSKQLKTEEIVAQFVDEASLSNAKKDKE